jgi:hypothetical protein
VIEKCAVMVPCYLKGPPIVETKFIPRGVNIRHMLGNLVEPPGIVPGGVLSPKRSSPPSLSGSGVELRYRGLHPASPSVCPAALEGVPALLR